MASDDPATALRRTTSTPSLEDDSKQVELHLSSIHRRRNLNHHSHHRDRVPLEIYQERLKAQRDTVEQDWFEQNESVYPHVYSSNSNSTSTNNFAEQVKLNVRRVGTKATDTLRKNTTRFFSPKITIQPPPDIPLRQVTSNNSSTSSSFNTITLPPLTTCSSSQSSSSLISSSPPLPPPTRRSKTILHNLLSSSDNTSSITHSPTSSLRNFPLPNSPELPRESFPTRTLTIDEYSPPSRRDSTLRYHHPKFNHISKNKKKSNSLHLQQITSNASSTTSSSTRPNTPPPGGTTSASSSLRPGGGLTRSPTEISTLGHRSKLRAKEELQKLLLKRKKLLSRNNNRSKVPIIPGEGEQIEEEEKEEQEEGKGIDKAILQRLKILGALIDESEKIETEILWEHQRGLLVFGLPKFSSAALFQFDPFIWTDSKFNSSPFTPFNFPCKPYWKWRDSEFMVDMGGDRDEEGWSYSSFFHSKHWTGEPSLFTSFVRRRKWIRTRIYIPLPTTTTTQTQTQTQKDDSFLAIDGTKALDQEEEEEVEIVDLKSACECLPLTKQEKLSLFYSVSTSNSSPRGDDYSIPPMNPFIPFRTILEYGSGSGKEKGGGKERELIWRRGIIEINEKRVQTVLKRLARIDRERLKLWEIWLQYTPPDCQEGFECSEWNEWRNGEKFKDWAEWLQYHNFEEEEEEESKLDWKIKQHGVVEEEDFVDEHSPATRDDDMGKPNLEDVWDLIEARLDKILSTFDYHLSRLSFLKILIACHPLSSTPFSTTTTTSTKHNHEGYDLPFETRRQKLESDWEKRLKWVSGVKEEIRRMEGGGGGVVVPPTQERVVERSRSERRNRKGKQKAIFFDNLN